MKSITAQLPLELRRAIYIKYLTKLTLDDRIKLKLPPKKLVLPNDLVEKLNARNTAVELAVASETQWSAAVHKPNGVWWMEVEVVDQEMNVYYRGERGGYQIWPTQKAFTWPCAQTSGVVGFFTF